MKVRARERREEVIETNVIKMHNIHARDLHMYMKLTNI